MRSLSPLERRDLGALDRERAELNYLDPSDDLFAANTYTRLLHPEDRDGIPLVTLYAVPGHALDVKMDDLLRLFAEPRRRSFQPASGAPLIPARLRPVVGGVLATDVETPEEGRRLLVLRTTGTVEYVSKWAGPDSDRDTGRHMLDVLGVIARSVQLSNAVVYFKKSAGGPAAWTVYVNVRRADRAYVTYHGPKEDRLPGGPDRCYDRHLQLAAELDASDADEGAAWQVGRELDLQLANAYGFTERLVHDAAGQLSENFRPEM